MNLSLETVGKGKLKGHCAGSGDSREELCVRSPGLHQYGHTDCPWGKELEELGMKE